MVQALSVDLRSWIVKVVNGGLSRNKAAKKFDVAIGTAVKLIQHVAESRPDTKMSFLNGMQALLHSMRPRVQS